ncbi:DTW domain-containing protein [Acidovorax sp. FG27]|uniref:DTW domain-containing protein n=1 Tax=Acidovorax sp. FG27 TaxID=3133652 RepID=UPI0030E80BF9
MNPADAPGRPRCPACLRPRAGCLCDLAAPVAHRAEVLILQHPLEVHHAKNVLTISQGSRSGVGGWAARRGAQ